jgi:hypothetical protein
MSTTGGSLGAVYFLEEPKIVAVAFIHVHLSQNIFKPGELL